MKKRFLSLTLLFLFILGMAMPASAHADLELSSLTAVGGIKYSSTSARCLPLGEAVTAEQSQDSSPRIIEPDPELNLYITRISAYPILIYLEDDGSTAYEFVSDLTYYATFPVNKTQSGAVSLTSAQVQAIKNRTDEWVATSDIAGKVYAFAGWHLETRVFYSANRPKYMEFWATATNSSDGAHSRLNLTKTSGVVALSNNFIIPTSMQDSYCNIGIAGNFYFTRTSNGQEGGFRFSGALTLNSDKNPYQ